MMKKYVLPCAEIFCDGIMAGGLIYLTATILKTMYKTIMDVK